MKETKVINIIEGVIFMLIGICCYIFPAQMNQYVAIVIGGYLLLRGLVLLITQFITKNTDYFRPILYLVAGALTIIGWQVMVKWIMVIIASIIILIGIFKLFTIRYYVVLNEKPWTALCHGLFYLIIGGVILGAALQDKFKYLLLFIVAAGLILIGIDMIYLSANKKDQPDLVFSGLFKNKENNNKADNVSNEKNNAIEADVTDEKIIEVDSDETSDNNKQ